jgi:hypothetical protein
MESGLVVRLGGHAGGLSGAHRRVAWALSGRALVLHLVYVRPHMSANVLA